MKPDINGRVKELLEEMVSRGHERAIQVAAWYRGEPIVDAWAGTDPGRGDIPIDGDSLFPVFSTSKGIAATVLLRLIERGLLDPEAALASYWPEFAAKGKGNTTLREAMSHRAGVPQVPEGVSAVDCADWAAMCRRVADLEPLWESGTRMYYHAITWGWVVGEAACRVTGRDFGALVQDEIFNPLGTPGFYLGIPPEKEDRVLSIDAFPPQAPAPGAPTPVPDPLGERSIPPSVKPLEAFMNRPEVRRACIPASNGIGNARSIAKHYAALSGRGAGGFRLLRPETVALATRLSKPPGVPLEGLAQKFGLGYGLYGPPEDLGSVFGHGGYGGSTGFVDTRVDLAFGLVKSRMGTAPGQEGSSQRAMKLIRESLGLAP
ncbi:MAG: beta-lactamase family protein [Spirochaetes bacterium]|nr:beta-lactamase family protein [Spirochaetota bacterium]